RSSIPLSSANATNLRHPLARRRPPRQSNSTTERSNSQEPPQDRNSTSNLASMAPRLRRTHLLRPEPDRSSSSATAASPSANPERAGQMDAAEPARAAQDSSARMDRVRTVNHNARPAPAEAMVAAGRAR